MLDMLEACTIPLLNELHFYLRPRPNRGCFLWRHSNDGTGVTKMRVSAQTAITVYEESGACILNRTLHQCCPRGRRAALLCVDCWAIFFYFFVIAGGAI
jgi:hypothetical protein